MNRKEQEALEIRKLALDVKESLKRYNKQLREIEAELLKDGIIYDNNIERYRELDIVTVIIFDIQEVSECGDYISERSITGTIEAPIEMQELIKEAYENEDKYTELEGKIDGILGQFDCAKVGIDYIEVVEKDIVIHLEEDETGIEHGTISLSDRDRKFITELNDSGWDII